MAVPAPVGVGVGVSVDVVAVAVQWACSPAAGASPSAAHAGTAGDGEVGEARAIAEGPLDERAHLVELRGRDRRHPVAALADEVLALAGPEERVARRWPTWTWRTTPSSSSCSRLR